jgi:hypothetical protein
VDSAYGPLSMRPKAKVSVKQAQVSFSLYNIYIYISNLLFILSLNQHMIYNYICSLHICSRLVLDSWQKGKGKASRIRGCIDYLDH